MTLEKIGCINRAGIRSVVMTTVSGTNIDVVPGIIDAVVAAGVNVFAFARYCPTSEEKDVGIEPLRYRKLLSDCDKKFKEYEAAGCQTLIASLWKPHKYYVPKHDALFWCPIGALFFIIGQNLSLS